MGEGKNWNSLEICKLVISAITPLAVFSLGVQVSEQNRLSDIKRDNIVREQTALFQQQARIREDTLSRENLRREDELRADSKTREDFLRAQDQRRSEQVRQNTIAAERLGKLIDRRAELWDQMSPDFVDLNDAVARFSGFRTTNMLEAEKDELQRYNDHIDKSIEDVERISTILKRKFQVYSFYFSPTVKSKFEKFSRFTEGKDWVDRKDSWYQFINSYEDFKAAIAHELAFHDESLSRVPLPDDQPRHEVD